MPDRIEGGVKGLQTQVRREAQADAIQKAELQKAVRESERSES